MKGVILAAGKGVRMREITKCVPKPLIPVANKPMLVHSTEALIRAGVKEIIIVVNYMHQMIRDYLGDGSSLGATINYVPQEQPMGTGQAVSITEKLVDGDDFVLMFADIMTPKHNIGSMVSEFQAKKPDAVLSVHYVDDPFTGAAVYVDENRVTRIIEKPPKGSSTTHYDNAGIFVWKPAIFDLLRKIDLSPRGEYEFTDAVQLAIRQGWRIDAFTLDGFWYNVSSPEELLKTNAAMIGQELSNGEPAIDDSSSIDASARLSDSCIIGPNCNIEQASIGKNVAIGSGVNVGSGSVIEEAIIESDVTVGSDCIIKHAFVQKGSKLADGFRLEGSPESIRLSV